MWLAVNAIPCFCARSTISGADKLGFDLTKSDLLPNFALAAFAAALVEDLRLAFLEALEVLDDLDVVAIASAI